MKNMTFDRRLRCALAGIIVVARRERSFRTQCILAVIAIAATAAVRPGLVWCALVAISVVLVLALEALNGALEYLMDRVHPDYSEEIGFAKDAAAAAVLIASIGSAFVGGMMLLSVAL
jgi:diacylglycerol kinase (ATP)